MSLATRTFTVTREDLVRYAAASGDHNPIHQDDGVARSVGLPGVIAHGMYTLALAARAVGEWFPGAEVVSLGCKFTSPVVVPAEGGVDLEVASVLRRAAASGSQETQRKARDQKGRPGDRASQGLSRSPGRSCIRPEGRQGEGHAALRPQGRSGRAAVG